MAQPALVWFRDDLRVADNPALRAALDSGRPVLCFFIFDDSSPEIRPLGGAARWWLHGSLANLADNLDKRGNRLHLFSGAAEELVPRIVSETDAAALFWNRRYGPEREIDARLKKRLRTEGLEVRSFPGRLVYEPGTVLNQGGGYYKVFTPFNRAAVAQDPPETPLPAPRELPRASFPKALDALSVTLEELALEPRGPDWAGGMRETWEKDGAGRGEDAAHKRLKAFIADHLSGYAKNRDRPDLDATSRLSPHLRFGEITPRQAVHAALAAKTDGAPAGDYDSFRAEIGWRDFSYQLLFSRGGLHTRNMNDQFDAMPWREDDSALRAWQEGRTGFPVVDAGMRQLWHQGYMHNRVRMIVASFLTKHLLIDWKAGESWFWDTLVDADPANNPAGWQWVAGSGADAQPYYRIFNPMTQGEKFDPQGDYVRQWVPEIADLPNRVIHRPWEAKREALEAAGVVLGETYPKPIVIHEDGRKRALAAFETIKRR
ncbi:MAG: deoxyribodipyrimidine photo-lyase [Salinarimonas sp.]|nr:deoxyribodipyrimidine photo-lyase [Salinarimonas sp.]